MNPLTPREELEIRITALLMGQLPPEEAAELLRQIAADPELITLHARLRHAVELLREARAMPEHAAPATPLVLSKERREKLLATFRGIKPLPSPTTLLAPKKRRDVKWLVPLGAAAAAMFVVGGLLFPSLSASKRAVSSAMSRGSGVSDPKDFISQPSAWGTAPEAPESEAMEDERSRARGYASQRGAIQTLDASSDTNNYALYAPQAPASARAKGVYLPPVAPARDFDPQGPGTTDLAGLATGGGVGVLAPFAKVPLKPAADAAPASGPAATNGRWYFSESESTTAAGAVAALGFERAGKAGDQPSAPADPQPAPIALSKSEGEVNAKLSTSTPKISGGIAAAAPENSFWDDVAANRKLGATAPVDGLERGRGLEDSAAKLPAEFRALATDAPALPVPSTPPPTQPASRAGDVVSSLFTVPVVEPHALSQPLSTAGKVNIDQPLAPIREAVKQEQPVAALSIAGQKPERSSGGVAATAERELQRRMQREDSAKGEADKGRAALASDDTEAAFAHFKNAAEATPDTPKTKDSRDAAVRGLEEAAVKLAEERISDGYYVSAVESLKEVLKHNPESKAAHKLLANIEAPDIFNKKMTPGFRARVEEVKQEQALGRLDLADKFAEPALSKDGYNKAAELRRQSVVDEKQDFGEVAYNSTRAQAMWEVTKEWQRPYRRFDKRTVEEGDKVTTFDTDFSGLAVEPDGEKKLADPSSETDGKETVALSKAGSGTLSINGGTLAPTPEALAAAPAVPSGDRGGETFMWAGSADKTNALEGAAAGEKKPANKQQFGASRPDAALNLGRFNGGTAGTLDGLGLERGTSPREGKKSGVEDDELGIPQEVEFEGFINYGSPIQTTSVDANGVQTVNVIAPSGTNAPIFATRKVTTHVTQPAAGNGTAQLGDVQLTAPTWDEAQDAVATGKPLAFTGVTTAPEVSATSLFTAGGTRGTLPQMNPADAKPATSGNRSGKLAVSANAIDALLFDDAGTPDMVKELGEVNGEKVEPAVDILSSTATAKPADVTKAKPAPIAPAKKAAAKKTDAKESKLAEKVDDFALLDLQTLAPAPSAPAPKAKVAKPQPAPAPVVVALQKSVAEPEPPAPPQKVEPPVPQPEVATKDNAFSTFSLNVSDVSFKLAGAALEKGAMPEPAGVRSEEFINALDYRDPEPAPGAPLAFASERARYPFAHNRDLLRLSVKTAAAGRQPGRPLNLVLLIDNSGSMERADRVRILREALTVLAKQLQPADKLSIITFSRTPRLWADGVAGDKASEFTDRVGEITPQGGTDLGAAIDLGYTTALKHYQVGSVNRVVLMTDGAANLGNVSAEALKRKVETHRKQGVAFDCFGIGWEGYNDDLLEQLSRNGDGRYGFLNTPEAASTEFAAQLAGALRVAASDVKVQVEFNPQRVTAYRQLGYAKHQLKKEQFRDNTVDAAEIGAAESGNALYTVEVNPRGTGDIATVRVRYKIPGTADYHEHEWTVPYTAPAPPLDQSSSSLRLAATAGAFAEMLAQSQFAVEVTTDKLLAMINGIPAIYGADPRPAKLEWMIRQAKSISRK